MKQTSRMSWSRSSQGLRPSTRNSPSNGVMPRIAFSAVLLPAPFGPIRPRMRPSSTRTLIPSSATVVPYTFRRPRASIQAMILLLLLLGFCGSRRSGGCFHQFFRGQTEPLDGFGDAGPLLGKKLLAFALEQQLPGTRFDEHAQPPLFLDQVFVDHLLVSFQDRERVDSVFRRDVADRGE